MQQDLIIVKDLLIYYGTNTFVMQKKIQSNNLLFS